MASSARSFSAAAEDDLSCPVCFNLLKDPNTPKELDCSHICCEACLETMVEGGRPVVECPECRHVTRVPKDGVVAMKTVYRLRNLVEKHYDHAQKKGEKERSALISNIPREREPAKDDEKLCPTHNIFVDFFCKKCNVTGCASCMMYHHKGPEHDFSDIGAAHDEQREQMLGVLSQMDTAISECECGIQELDLREEKMTRFNMEQTEILNKHYKLMIAKINESVRRLKEDFNGFEQPKIERVRSEKIRLQDRVTEMKSMKTLLEEALETCDSAEYVVQHAGISENMLSELRKVSTKPSSDLDPVIGKARFKVTRQNIVMGTLLQVKPCDLIQLQEFGTMRGAQNISVAASDSGFVAVCYDKTVLTTYRRNKAGDYRKDMNISLSKETTTAIPICVAVSSAGKYFVVREKICVEIYSRGGQYEGNLYLKPTPDGKGEDICKTLQPCYLLVEEDGGLLVTGYNSMIVQFTRDGVFQHSVTTTVSPHRITAMPNGKLAATNWRENKMFMIDMLSPEGTLEVIIPHAQAICYHEESDTLLVGRCLKREDQDTLDTSTGVIEQYCPNTGALVRRVYGGDFGEHCNPRDMVVTNDGTLIVAGAINVKAFAVSILE